MKFTFACKKIALNDSIKEYAEKKISKLDRYFPEEADAFVTFAVEKKEPLRGGADHSGRQRHVVPGSGGGPRRGYAGRH